jgi:hypothetical protein
LTGRPISLCTRRGNSSWRREASLARATGLRRDRHECADRLHRYRVAVKMECLTLGGAFFGPQPACQQDHRSHYNRGREVSHWISSFWRCERPLHYSRSTRISAITSTRVKGLRHWGQHPGALGEPSGAWKLSHPGWRKLHRPHQNSRKYWSPPTCNGKTFSAGYTAEAILDAGIVRSSLSSRRYSLGLI